MVKTTLHTAVQNEHIATRQGFMQKLFAVWFDAFVYNQIWEDPEVDLEALEIDSNSKILTISSGGCNALNYLLAGPQSVTAVDLNRHHIQLLNLKIAAIRSLPSFKSFFAFFGQGFGKTTGTDYQRYISPVLNVESRDYWESNSLFSSLLYGSRINMFRDDGLYDHSRNGYFLRFFHKFANVLGCRPDKVLEATSIEEQAQLYAKYINPFWDNFLIKTISSMPVTMFGLGIPPQQYDELKKEVADGTTIVDIYRDRARKLACDYPIDQNYFAWQAFARKYDTENQKAVPEYLKEANFVRLKANVSRIAATVGSVTDEITNSPKNTFNRFVFLDAQDWMDIPTINQLWTAIAEFGEPGSRIIFRTAGSTSPIAKSLKPELAARFAYHEAASTAFFEKDRASIYGGFHLYHLK